MSYVRPYTRRGVRFGTEVRKTALASHKYRQDSSPGLEFICGSDFIVVSHPCSERL